MIKTKWKLIIAFFVLLSFCFGSFSSVQAQYFLKRENSETKTQPDKGKRSLFLRRAPTKSSEKLKSNTKPKRPLWESKPPKITYGESSKRKLNKTSSIIRSGGLRFPSEKQQKQQIIDDIARFGKISSVSPRQTMLNSLGRCSAEDQSLMTDMGRLKDYMIKFKKYNKSQQKQIEQAADQFYSPAHMEKLIESKVRCSISLPQEG